MNTDMLITWGALATAVLAVAALWRLTRPARVGVVLFIRKMLRGLEIVVGSDEVRDPLSGALIQPATPDMGTRQSMTEQQLKKQEKLLEEVVVGAVDEARRSASSAAESARAAASAATSAAAAAAAATTIAESARQEVRAVVKAIEAVGVKVDDWQTGDRLEAEALRSALHEVGIDATVDTGPHTTPTN